MKIFEGSESSWQEKVNFVDDNDVFVGYDIGQDCCEDAGWFISSEITPYSSEITPYSSDCEYSNDETPDISEYNFDKDFFECVDSSDLDEGGMVAFRLISDGKPDLYLHLYNAHNGYYGHGFEVKHSGIVVKDDYL